MLQSITFTGADHTVPRHRLLTLCQKPVMPVEIAFLISEPKMGSARYPSISVITSLAEIVKSCRQKVALHLCGGVARSFLQKTWRISLLPGLAELLPLADRIQINAANDLLTETNMERAQAYFASPVIFQCRGTFPPARANRQWLFDVSGGRGLMPETWPELPSDQMVGLAGGLGPGRVAPLLRHLGYTTRPYWIDMESSLRDSEDRFSIYKCIQVLDEARNTLLEIEHDKIQHGWPVSVS